MKQCILLRDLCIMKIMYNITFLKYRQDTVDFISMCVTFKVKYTRLLIMHVLLIQEIFNTRR